MIPVFYHIPKCAGTYVKNSHFANLVSINGPEYSMVQLNDDFGRGLAILYTQQFNQIKGLKIQSKCFSTIGYDQFKSNQNNVSIDFLIICARGFQIRQELFNLLDNDYKQYMLLRNPYHRAYSFYHYLTSQRSKHEPTHGSISSKTFEKYLQSYELEDCWLIRQLSNIKNNEDINQIHFNATCQILDQMIVKDIGDADILLKEILGTNHTGSRPIYRNDSKSVQMRPPLSSFDQLTIDKYKERTYWDHKIYNHYVNKSQP